MTRCIFSLLPSLVKLEVAPHIGSSHLPSKHPFSGITLQDLSQLEQEQRSILEFALKEHFRSCQSSFAKEERLHKIEIPSKTAMEFFQKTAAQGMLSFEGKKIFFDPFISFDLAVEVFEEETSLSIEAYFVLGSLRIPSRELQWSYFDKKGFVLYRDTLRLLNASYDPKIVKKLFSFGKHCSKKEKSFFEDLKEEGLSVTCLFEEKKEDLRKGVMLDLYGMELSLEQGTTIEMESELKEAGYQKKREGLFSCPSDRAAEALELLFLGGWRLEDRRGRTIIPLTDCKVVAEEVGDALFIHPDLDFEGTKKKWRELAFEGSMLVNLSKDALGLVLPKQLPPYLRDPKFRIKPMLPIKIETSCFGELEGIALPEAFQRLFGKRQAETQPDVTFAGKLFPYQQKGLHWLQSLRECKLNGLLADEMGLGKTVQVIAFLSLPKSLPALIVVPASLVVQWKREIEKFLPGVPVHIDEESRDGEILTSSSICIASFGMVRKERGGFTSKRWQALILDEAHAILNQKTQLFEALNSIRASFRLAMTGTPLINRQQDFESLFSFLSPNLLEKGLEPHKIKMRTSPLILRRTQLEVFEELPEKIEEEVLVALTPFQRVCYEKLQKQGLEPNILESLKSGKQPKQMQMLEVILRLRQVCLHPRLIDPVPLGETLGEEPIDLEESSKFALLLLDLEEMMEGKKKVIVCSSFAKALRLLYKRLPFQQNQLLILDGATSNRSDIVEAFETAEEGMILLLSLKAGGVGLNLPSTDAFFLLDPWWNEAMEQQAIYRALRLGRKKRLIVKKYIAIGTIEEKIQLLKKSKKNEENLILGDQVELDEELLQSLFEL